LLRLEGDPFYTVREAPDAIGRIGPAAIPDLIAALKDHDPGVRVAAAKALGAIGPKAKSAVTALIERLEDNNAHVRAQSAEALGVIGPEAQSAVPALLMASRKDKYGGARANVIRALVAIDPGAKGLAATLVAALADEDGRPRLASAEALAQVRPVA